MSGPASPAALAAAQVGNLVGALAVGVVLARALGPAGQGVLQSTLVVPAVLALLLSVGGGAAVTYGVGRGQSPAALIGWVLVLAAVAGVVAAGIAGAFPVLFAPAGRSGLAAVAVRLTALYVPGQIVAGGLAALALGQTRPAVAAAVALAPRVFQLAVLLGLWRVQGHIALVQAAMVAAAAPWAGATAGAAGLVRWWPRWRSAVARQAVGYGLRGHLGNVAQFLNYRAGLWLAGTYLAPAVAGRYWLAISLSELLWYLPQATASVWLPHVAREKVSPWATAVQARALGWLSAALGLLGATAAGWVVPRIWGSGFAPAVGLLWGLLPGTVAFVWAKVLAADLAGRGRPEWGAMSSLAGLVGFGAAAGWGLGRIGVAGLVVAQSVAYGLGVAVLASAFRRWAGPVPVRFLFWPRWSDWRSLWRLWRGHGAMPEAWEP